MLLAAALAGCGSGEEPTGPPRDYGAELARACAATDGAFDRVETHTGEVVLTATTDAWLGTVERLAKLRPPQARRAEHARVVEAARELERTLRATAERVGVTGSAEELAQTVVRSRSAADSLQVAAEIVGAPRCGASAEHTSG